MICLLTLGVALLAAFLSRQIFPVVISIARGWKLMDQPGGRKLHAVPTPRLGGIGLIPAVWLGGVLGVLLSKVSGVEFSTIGSNEFGYVVMGLVFGSSGYFLIGLVDDLRATPATAKLAAQVIVAAFTVGFIPVPESIFGITISQSVWMGMAFLWLVVIPNSVNILDGIDGLTGTLFGLFMGTLMVIAIFSGQLEWLPVLGPLLAAVVCFLFFNWRPARLFLGDSGSLCLGFVVAYLSVSFSVLWVGQGDFNPILLIGLCSIWLIDTGLAIVRRYLAAPHLQTDTHNETFLRRIERDQVARIMNVLRPDQGHVHHRLLRRGFSVEGAVFWLAGLWLCFGGLLIPFSLMLDSTLVPTLPLRLIAILSFLLGVVLYLSWLTRGKSLGFFSRRSVSSPVSSLKDVA